MALTVDSPEKMFVHELKDLYSAESQLVEALPKVAKAVSSREVKDAINSHLKETKKQVQRLEKIADELGYSPKGVKCKGMAGLVGEADEVMKEDEMPKELLTEALVTGGQKIEHYEIVGYKSAIKSARELGHQNAVKLLQESLTEEQNALKTLEKLSK